MELNNGKNNSDRRRGRVSFGTIARVKRRRETTSDRPRQVDTEQRAIDTGSGIPENGVIPVVFEQSRIDESPIESRGEAGGDAILDSGSRGFFGGKPNRRGRPPGSRNRSTIARDASTGGDGARTSNEPRLGLVDEVKPDIEQPPIIKAKKVSKAINTASKDKEQLLGLIALSLGTVYNITATKYGNHWRLSEPELNTLSVATQDALETLPEGIYTDVLKIVGKYGAWFALAYAAYSITEPRISESIRVKRLKYQPVNRVANESNNVSERSDSKEPNVSNIDRTPYTPASAYGYAAAASQQNP